MFMHKRNKITKSKHTNFISFVNKKNEISESEDEQRIETWPLTLRLICAP